MAERRHEPAKNQKADESQESEDWDSGKAAKGTGSKTTTRQRAAKHPRPAPRSGARPRPPEALIAESLPALTPPPLPQPAPGQAINLGPIAGTDSPTGAIGAGAVDLCEIAPGGQVALGGEVFSGNGVGDGAWGPAIALHVRPGTLSGWIEFDRSFGHDGTLYDLPPPPGASQLPAGTIQVFGLDYALVARVIDSHPADTRLVRIHHNAPHWPTVPGSRRDASWREGNETQISGYHAPDGWVYIVADGFARNHTVRLYRCHPATFTDRNTWWPWGIGNGDKWAWNTTPTPLSGDLFGELSLRLIDNMSVLSGFNATTGNVEVRVADDVTQVLAPETPVTVVATQATVPQNYGGYIVPGSTLDQAIILVSQWNTDTNNPCNVQQFVVNLNR
jgi:hypothetical protein